MLNLGCKHFYAGQYGRARQAVLRGIWQCPGNRLRDRAFLLLAISLLPKPAITMALRLKRLWLGLPPALEARSRAARVT